MSACIYCIKNKINNKCYIGQTINFTGRKSKHLRDLRKGNHINQHLQRAFDKYGEENFYFEIIEEIENYDEIGEREKYWIEKIGYYNIDKGRNGFCPIALRNMSESHMNSISSQRKIKDKNIVYMILALTDFCDGIVRPLVALSGYSRVVIRAIKNRETYKDISEIYDQKNFDEKLKILQKAIEYYNIDYFSINPGSSCPLKNRFVLFLIKNTNLTYRLIGEKLKMTKGGIRACYDDIRSHQREVNMDYSDEQILKILKILVGDDAVLSSISLEKM